MNSVEPKIESVDYEESKPEKLDTNENQPLTEEDLIPTKEKNTEQVLLISSNESPTTNPKENSGKDSKILPVPEINTSNDVQNLITCSKVSTSQSIQTSVNDKFESKEKDISINNNDQGKSTVQLSSTVINDSDNDNYEVETLDEDLLESEESLRNLEKTECDQEVIEVSDDSDLSEIDPEINDTVETAIKSTGNNNNE